MKIEFGTIEDGAFVHERDLVDTPRDTLDGWVRVVGGRGEMRIVDDLWALLLNLGLTAPARVLGGGEDRFEWRLSSQPRTMSVSGGNEVVLTQTSTTEGTVTLVVPAAELWPAAVGAASRFRAWLERVRGADAREVTVLREAEATATALVRDRGWRLPAAPEADPSSAAVTGGAAWSGAVLLARDLDGARRFYREVLGVRDVPISPADGAVGPPQWVGTAAAADDVLERALDAGGAELDMVDGRKIWMDPWGALVAVGEAGLPVARSVLASSDPEGAAAFWSDAFGWTVESEATDDPPRWRHWLAVDDLDAAVGRAEAAGGRIVARGEGRVWLADPFEGEFGLCGNGSARAAEVRPEL